MKVNLIDFTSLTNSPQIELEAETPEDEVEIKNLINSSYLLNTRVTFNREDRVRSVRIEVIKKTQKLS